MASLGYYFALIANHSFVMGMFYGLSQSFLIIVSIVLVWEIPAVQSSYIISIPPKDEECFLINSPGAVGGTIFGNFDHLDDNLSAEPLSIVIIDNNEEHVLFRSRRRATEGIFRVKLNPDQQVDLCLQNGIVTAGRGKKTPTGRAHDGLARVVGFDFSVEEKNEKKEAHSQNDRNIDAAKELTRQMNNLMNHHGYMRVREMQHREVVESTFTQLMWWLILEALCLLAIAAGQILYFRNFLERRRYL